MTILVTGLEKTSYARIYLLWWLLLSLTTEMGKYIFDSREGIRNFIFATFSLFKKNNIYISPLPPLKSYKSARRGRRDFFTRKIPLIFNKESS